ncbi:MAG: M48 family metalloprotease [Acidobacteriota bacterium]|nr:M48 family metalloprotease [Acidobacteriota bacterium]
MPLSFDQQAAAVARLTTAAEAAPKRYATRVVAWIALGYVIVASLLALALALSAGVVAAIIAFRAYALFKLAWIPIAAAWFLARSLFVKLDEPEGRLITEEEAPRLFAVLDEVRALTHVPALDSVLLVRDMNAAVVEMPRFGGLLGYTRHLQLGLPLLITHSAEEMKSILAHELGHLSAEHGRIAAWSWRVRVTWSRLLTGVDARNGFIAGSVQKLVQWYFDRLMPVTLVQARRQEHAADDFSRQITSAETAARALAWLTVARMLIEERLWKPLWERVPFDPEPPSNPLLLLLQKRAEVLAPPFQKELDEALARVTSIDDTHPSLRDRLQHLGVADPALTLSERCAALEWLGNAAEKIVAESDAVWFAEKKELWAEHHEAAAKARAVAEATADPAALLDEAQVNERAAALVQLGRDDEAFALYEQLRVRDPQNAHAMFQMGRILVERGDLSGITQLSAAMELDVTFTPPVCEVAYNALRAKGLDKDAYAWAERHRDYGARVAQAQHEARSLSVRDELLGPALPEEVVQKIVQDCRKARWVKTVWIGRKQLHALPQTVHFVAVRPKLWRFAGNARFNKLANALGTFDEPVMVFMVTSGSLIRRLHRVPGARQSMRGR